MKRFAFLFVFVLAAGIPVHSQLLPGEVELPHPAQVVDCSVPYGSEGMSPLCYKAMRPVQAGDIFPDRQPLPLNWPDNLIVDYGNEDHRKVWIAKEINSCRMFCGRPMTFRKAMFDRKMVASETIFTILQIADIELTHRNPCFTAHTCVELDPLYGQTRGQAYGVAAGQNILQWIGDAYLRAGSTKGHVGGLRPWWIIHTIGSGFAIGGIIRTVTNWHR